MANNWRQASFLDDPDAPRADSGGLLWRLDDPALPATLPNGRREPARANQALRDYLALGPMRSLAGLLSDYAVKNKPLPGRKLLAGWQARFAWEPRARHHDELRAQQRREEIALRRQQVLLEGVATTLERVAELKEIYAALKQQLRNQARVWQNQVRWQRSGADSYEKIESERFNAALLTQLRGVLDDLARETGGRPTGAAPAQPAPPEDEAPTRVDFSRLSKEELDVMEKALRAQGLADELFP